MKDEDTKLIFERWTERNKWRGPGSPGVGLARGYVLQVLSLIDDEEIHLCADREALEEALDALRKAYKALSHDKDDVPSDNHI